MEYPLLIKGERAGSLSVETDGLYTLLEVWTGMIGELTRVWVHGGGKTGYLGVMQPWSGGMYLKRRLSRRELEDFPTVIEFASDQGGGSWEREKAGINAPAETQTVEAAQRQEDLLWLRRPDGSLTAFDGSGALVALPVKLKRPMKGADIRRISGADYIVFRY